MNLKFNLARINQRMLIKSKMYNLTNFYKLKMRKVSRENKMELVMKTYRKILV